MNYGCIVEDKTSHSILHFVEKPRSYISTLINCGVYIFSTQIFSMLQVGSGQHCLANNKYFLLKIKT